MLLMNRKLTVTKIQNITDKSTIKRYKHDICVTGLLLYLYLCRNTFFTFYTHAQSRFVTIVHCKSPLYFTVVYLFIPGLLLSFSFVILGSSLRGSSLDQWLVIHFIGHYITLSHVLFILVVCGLDQPLLFPCSVSSVHLMSLLLRLGGL